MAVDYHQFINRDLPMWERACTSKARFDSRAEARSLARHGRGMSGGLDSYHCQRCDGWHLGHRRSRHM